MKIKSEACGRLTRMAAIAVCALGLTISGGLSAQTEEKTPPIEHPATQKKVSAKEFMSATAAALLNINVDMLQYLQSVISWPSFDKINTLKRLEIEAANRKNNAQIKEVVTEAKRRLDTLMDQRIQEAKTMAGIDAQERETLNAELQRFKTEHVPKLRESMDFVEQSGQMLSDILVFAATHPIDTQSKKTQSFLAFKKKADQQTFDAKINALKAIGQKIHAPMRAVQGLILEDDQ